MKVQFALIIVFLSFSLLTGPDFFLPIDPPKPKRETIIEDVKMGLHLHHLLPVSIGEPPQILNLKISTGFCGIWLYNNNLYPKGFNSSQSNTFRLTSLSGSISNSFGPVVKDNIKFLSFSFDNFNFILVNDSFASNLYDGAIGFGNNCKILTAILQDDLLEKCSVPKVLWFKLEESLDESGELAIGYYPKAINEDLKHYHTISLVQFMNNSQWSFKLFLIYFNDGQHFNINTTISIGIDGHMLSVTKVFFEWLVERYFKDAINNQQCSISNDNAVELFCKEDYDAQSAFPAVMSFIVGKWSLKISSAHLFHRVKLNNSLKTLFSIIYYPKRDEFYIAQKILGTATVVYDKENLQIGVYTGNRHA